MSGMIGQLRAVSANLSVRQRWTIAAAAVLVVTSLLLFTRWSTQTVYKPLYTALAPGDAGAVVAKLKQANVEYRLEDNGTAVLVPDERLSELRLQMAVDGLPKTGRLGFEIFDKTNLGLTDFAEHVNYRRALEGELERSLGHLQEIEEARVHLTFPKDSVFLEARQPAKASVMLRLRGGVRLSEQNVQAVCHLAASAVEGLAPEAVSVLDTNGNLLNRPRSGSDDEQAASEAALDYRRQIERELTRKIRGTLEPLLGAGRFETGVSVECDLTSGERSEEMYDPERSVMLTSQKSEDSTAGVSTAGVPGTPSNLPRAAAPALSGRAGLNRSTENITYQSSRVVNRVRQPQGTVKRVSVGLLVDQDVRWEGTPPNQRRVLVPPSAETLRRIRDVVAGVVNFDQRRGDQIVVESLAFDATLRQAPPAPEAVPPGSPFKLQWPPDTRLLGGLVAFALFALAAGGWLFVRKLWRSRLPAGASVPTALPPGAEGGEPSVEEQMEQELAGQADARQRLELEVIKSIKMPDVTTKKAEVLVERLRTNLAKDSNPSVMVLRKWLSR
ncbi:MAG TPA: flagellar basal-body MS-ring/collar protein FliF [Bryobacteraceae bacterium]|nr:flagellar basal-body MS-ring/collar protein FliF [Bryobacteraceae bacterium]